MDYKSSGVDVKRAEALVHWIKTQKNSSHNNRILSSIGGYASLFKIQFPKMKEPCLASSTDGVGTKLKIAVAYSSLPSLGQDLVAMCVNDLICVGAQPLFFLDYLSCSQLDIQQSKDFISGVYRACNTAKTALIGGETAEMPDVYQNNEFDCAGFAVGIVDQPHILGSHRVKKGARLIGLPSHGFHSNGYSLLRKVFAEDMDAWKEELLKPTALYVEVFEKYLQGQVQALAHITGGGMDNILRVVPKGSYIQLRPWKIPRPFVEVQKRTQMSFDSLLKTLNCGIGLVCFVDETNFKNLMEALQESEFKPIDLGVIQDIQKDQKSTWHLDFSKLEEMSLEQI